MRSDTIYKTLTLSKFVHGGQCLAETADGKKIFVWGGLPGETVDVLVTKKKSSYLEGIVMNVVIRSEDRIEPREPKSYLSTSPWQIMSFAAERKYKEAILRETFQREGLPLIDWSEFLQGDNEYHYRNKQEFGFWGDDDGLHLAHYVRGSHGKQIISGSALAIESINTSARAVVKELNRLDIWAGKLKTLILRTSQKGDTVAALFVKEHLEILSNFTMPENLQGVDIYYSDPKSPASVTTEKLYSFGDIKLVDSINGINITYDVLSFFQVNVPVFEEALKKITAYTAGRPSIDLYSGVGTIGVVTGSKKLIEVDENNCSYAKLNSAHAEAEVVHASSEEALDHITQNEIVIVDPPRAGLHRKLVEKLAGVRPPHIIYLSCNPITQARDVKLLETTHKVVFAQGFNFFPRTPHVESLIILERIA